MDMNTTKKTLDPHPMEGAPVVPAPECTQENATLRKELASLSDRLAQAQRERDEAQQAQRQFFDKMNQLNGWYNELLAVVYEGDEDVPNERMDPRDVVRNLRRISTAASQEVEGLKRLPDRVLMQQMADALGEIEKQTQRVNEDRIDAHSQVGTIALWNCKVAFQAYLKWKRTPKLSPDAARSATPEERK